jgi:hypothetical protein
MAIEDQKIKIQIDSNVEVTRNTNALGKSLGGVEDAAKETAKASKI